MATITRVSVLHFQDKMCLLGWPTAVLNTSSVSERDLRILTGETIHLGCKALLLLAVYCVPTSPWWRAAECGSSGKSGPALLGDVVSGSGLVKRRRRIGPVKSLT